MNYRASTLEAIPFRTIHECFAAAFADYAVASAVMSEAQLWRRAGKNNYAPELSVGAWAGDELVAVSLTGVDAIAGETRAYDICTGVVPAHRGRGIAGTLMRELLSHLQRIDVAAFQLEVLQGNKSAIRAYEKAGFTVTRGLSSFAERAGHIMPASSRLEIRPIDLEDLLDLSAQLEFEPSYEQRDAAIAHLGDALFLLGAYADGQCLGGVAYDPETQWLMRLVTHRDQRRRGVAAALLAELARGLPADTLIKAVNVDARDEATLCLMGRSGFRPSISQWEMRLELGGARPPLGVGLSGAR